MLGDNHFKLRLVRLQPTQLWNNDVRSEDEFIFVFMKGGMAQFVSSGITQRLVAGDVLVFSGGSNGKLYAAEKHDCVFNSFTLFFDHLFPLFASDEISLLHNVQAGFKTAKIYPKSSTPAMESLRLLETAPSQPSLEHRSQLLRIAASILSGELKNAHASRGGFVRAEDHLMQVFEKLSSAELLNLPVEELAAKFSCSRRHLNRLFHQHFGLSIASLRMEMRLLKAVSLLRDPQAKVINVAEQCGFNHLGLFNTCFKRRYGTSPGQWRKQILNSEKATSKNVAKPSCPLHANGLCPWGGQVTDPVKMTVERKASDTAESYRNRNGGYLPLSGEQQPGTTLQTRNNP